jgi:tRNA-specific 2-thiouridylase
VTLRPSGRFVRLRCTMYTPYLMPMTFADDILDRVRAAVGIDPDGGRTLVVAAMSGGVDSTVVAGLLKAAGYNVAGITLQLYDHGEAVARKGACCAGQDIHDARKAAAALDIPHYVLDFESRFKDAVIEEFADAYVRGETPIPCVACNQTVKFADLLSRAKALGAACLATGHYIACVDRGDGSGHRDLRTPADMNRDQSYFLFQTTQAQADYLRFPLASFTKDETRDFARQMGLAIADKPDSQDICFVPDGNYVPVIQRLRPEAGQPGDIVHEDGRVLGRHKGIVHYTIGQRRGIGIAAAEPLYVTRLDAASATVVVGPKSALARDVIALRDVNWLGEGAPQGEQVLVKIRSTRPPVPAVLRAGADGRLCAVLDEAEFGVSPGQACVFYDGSASGARVLGGGYIVAGLRSDDMTAADAETPEAAVQIAGGR